MTEFLRPLSRHKVAEQLDQTDADIANTLTFTEPIESIEIYHTEDSPQEFVVNGLTIRVGANGWRSPIAGTPSQDVEIPAGVNCIITRLV